MDRGAKAVALKVGVGGLLVVVGLVAIFGLRVQDHVGPALLWMQEHVVAGALTFSALYCVSTVLFIPGSILSLGAGVVFGCPLGSLVVWLGACVGAMLAFLLGRFLLRERIAVLAKRYSTWQGVEIALEEEGWKLVLLLRLSPVVPFSALNYALGLTSVPFLPYAWTTAAGIIPGTVMFVYVGSLAKDIQEIVSGKTHVSPAVTIVTSVVSGIFIIGAGLLTAHYARQAIHRKLERDRDISEDFEVLTDDEEEQLGEDALAGSTRRPLLR